MKEYTQQARSKSRTLESNPKASRQAPIDVILQQYTDRNTQRYTENELIQGKFDTAQHKEIDEDELLQGKFQDSPTTKSVQLEEKTNNTGLPDNLKSGIENLSGYSMDDVRVHYNSSKPAQLQALAYTQGTDIHVAPGQEKYLPHEAWHVVQQMQGRVQPTMQMQGINVNDNEGLEKEADVMGRKALSHNIEKNGTIINKKYDTTTIQKISFYHGTTIEDAQHIVTNINPSLGKGEFGVGFYTVFAEEQAKHIAMYYWNKEQKWTKARSGVAVVKISIPDNWWKDLMKTSDERYKVIFRTDHEGFNSEDDPYEEREAEPFEFDEDTAFEPNEDTVDWMPQNFEDLEYEEDSEIDLEKDIIIGPIKDNATPYMQVVFGLETGNYLLNDEETIKTIVWQQTYEGAIGSDVYRGIKTNAVDEIGSLHKTDRIKCLEFMKKCSNIEDINTQKKRYDLLMNIFSAINDLPDDVIKYLKEKGLTGEDDNAVVYNWYINGFPTDQH